MLIAHRCTKCGHPDYQRRPDKTRPDELGHCECGCLCTPGKPELIPTFNFIGQRIERIVEPGARLDGDGSDSLADGAPVRACGCDACKALYAHLTTGAPAPEPTEPTPAEYRAWAAANNIPCPPSGRIPAAVREAYTAAHS
ncbi:Lsr2 family protein [Thermomonospora cellulosilytica]|uniref:Lsr2 DNA-binding domain-containing protein n=1 Tax=Thermomonospora cellulosilytica TaxID=1411118 RepID=A0A7W3R803_9ACTN|nr:Lsr2 family protein [Thermomonospora cellulosilytica]MBA9003763.1 hypothetical protein [Thermomonospora cellulosilytica]